MAHDVGPLVVIAVCYAISVNLRIELEIGNVSLGAAFAPALVLLGRGSVGREVGTALAATTLSAILGFARRRSIVDVAAEAGALAVCYAGAHLVLFGFSRSRIGPSSSVVVLAAGTIGVFAYSFAAGGWKRVGRRTSTEIGDLRVWALLQAVLASAYGLMILVHQQIGWPALATMLVLLALSKREFDRYAEARRTLTQTVSALEALENASLF